MSGTELTSLGLEVGDAAAYPHTLRTTLKQLDDLFVETRLWSVVRRIVEIPHAAILTLPTTPVTLLAAPAAGLVRFVPYFAVETVFGAGALTNVDGAATLQAKLGTIALGPTLAVSELVATGADILVPVDAKLTSTKANLSAQALTLTCANGALGAFTGGHIANLLRVTFWTMEVPVGAAKAYAKVGAGANGTVQICADLTGVAGNAYTVEVKVGVGNDIAMSATLTGTAIRVTLGTNGGGTVDNTKNTATLIAAAVHALAGVSSAASGTGVTALTGAEGPTTFANGA